MPKLTKEYVANLAIRIILQQIGKAYGYEIFDKKRESQWEKVLQYFGKRCCYCGQTDKLQVDHIIGMNKDELGFDCVGNIAPACESCNNKKRKGKMNYTGFAWKDYLKAVCGNNEQIYSERANKIEKYMKAHNYPPKGLGSNSYDFKELKKRIDRIYDSICEFLNWEP